MSVTLKFQEAQVGQFGGDTYIMLRLPDRDATVRAKKFISEMAAEKPYVAELKRYRKKRSLNANAYFWVLAGKLAAVMRVKTSEEIYRGYVREIGDNFEIVPLRDDAKSKWIANWEAQGLGWICDDLGPCKHTEGYSNILCYYGSSTYDSKQMACLIDLVVYDCKDHGIETRTPEELERMKEEWAA